MRLYSITQITITDDDVVVGIPHVFTSAWDATRFARKSVLPNAISTMRTMFPGKGMVGVSSVREGNHVRRIRLFNQRHDVYPTDNDIIIQLASWDY